MSRLANRQQDAPKFIPVNETPIVPVEYGAGSPFRLVAQHDAGRRIFIGVGRPQILVYTPTRTASGISDQAVIGRHVNANGGELMELYHRKQERFNRLFDAWREEVKYSSRTIDMIEDPSFSEILSMGRRAIPFLVSRLTTDPLLSIAALRAITGENPVLPEHSGKVRMMAEDWQNWAKRQ